MSLSEALKTPPKSEVGGKCLLRAVLKELTPTDGSALLEAVKNERDWTGAALERVMRTQGHKLPARTITRHRKGDCACDTR